MEAFGIDDPSILENTNFTPPHRRAARRVDGDVDEGQGRIARPSIATPLTPRCQTRCWAAAASSAFLALPPYVWLALFLVAPLGADRRDQLPARAGPDRLRRPWTPTLVQYQQRRRDPSYLRLLGISALMALIVALIATVLAFPSPTSWPSAPGRARTLYLILLLVPFATSYLLRVMAWRLMLGQEGAINSFLEWPGSSRSRSTCSSTRGRRW